MASYVNADNFNYTYLFYSSFPIAGTVASSVEKQQQTGTSRHLLFLEEMKNIIYLLNTNIALSKNMQIQFNNQLGKCTVSVLGVGAQKSLANGFFPCFCVCASVVSSVHIC